MEVITKIIFTDNEIYDAIKKVNYDMNSISWETLLALKQGAEKYFEYKNTYDNDWERWGRDNNFY